MFDATGFTGEQHPIERRHRRRQRTYLHATLVVLADGVSGDCTIRNLSEAGARLDLIEPAFFANGSVVVVTKTGAAHEVDLVWRRGHEAGVRFDSTHDLNRGGPTHWGLVHRLWIESRPR
jgi:hypothetical protein